MGERKLEKEKKQSWEIANKLKLFDEAINDGYRVLSEAENNIDERLRLGEKINKEKTLRPLQKQINKLLREKRHYEKKLWVAI